MHGGTIRAYCNLEWTYCIQSYSTYKMNAALSKVHTGMP